MTQPITDGKDFNFFADVIVSNTTFADALPVVINIRGQQSFSLVVESGVRVEYSFNGTTVHGSLTPATATEAIQFDNRRVSKIWFQAASSSSVRVEAWAKV